MSPAGVALLVSLRHYISVQRTLKDKTECTMFGISYYKADSSTFVIQTTGGKVRRTGKGLGFFYHPALTSVSAIPTNVQESPFIFSLQTSDFQTVKVQGQITWRVVNPEK